MVRERGMKARNEVVHHVRRSVLPGKQMAPGGSFAPLIIRDEDTRVRRIRCPILRTYPLQTSRRISVRHIAIKGELGDIGMHACHLPGVGTACRPREKGGGPAVFGDHRNAYPLSHQEKSILK